MAKITRYTKDKVGAQLLSISAVVIIIWLAIAGLNLSYPPGGALAGGPPQSAETSSSGAIWCYLAIPVVSYLWGLANFERAPGAYKSRRMAGLVNLIPGSGLGFLVWLFLFASRNQELLSDFLLGQ